MVLSLRTYSAKRYTKFFCYLSMSILYCQFLFVHLFFCLFMDPVFISAAAACSFSRGPVNDAGRRRPVLLCRIRIQIYQSNGSK